MDRRYALLAALAALLIVQVAVAQSYQVSFTVNRSGYVTIYIAGLPSTDSVDLHWGGIEPAPPQGGVGRRYSTQ